MTMCRLLYVHHGHVGKYNRHSGSAKEANHGGSSPKNCNRLHYDVDVASQPAQLHCLLHLNQDTVTCSLNVYTWPNGTAFL